MNAAYNSIRKQGNASSQGRRAQLDVCIRFLVLLTLLGLLLYPKPEPHRAILKPLEVLAASQDPCIEVGSQDMLFILSLEAAAARLVFACFSSLLSHLQATGSAKVALLFLTHGNLYHEPSWSLWFQSAVGQLPAETAARSVCRLNDTVAAQVSTLCSTPARKLKHDNPIAQQLLFNVYIHLAADIDGKNLAQKCLHGRYVFSVKQYVFRPPRGCLLI